MKSLSYRELVKRLRKYDSDFKIDPGRGKGSERWLYHPDIAGNAKSYPIKCHGEGMTMKKGSMKAIIRRFNLPKDIFD